MQRTYIKDLSQRLDGKSVLLDGFVHEVRDLSKIKFILLRDITGIVQIVAPKDKVSEELFKEIPKILPESVLEVQGVVKANKEAKKGFEVLINDLKILSRAEKLPMQVFEKDKSIQTDLSTRLNYRSLDLRKPEIQAVFKIQSEIANSFRAFFKDFGFVEIQPPSIISSASEGGTELFPVHYFEKEAFLAQSPQLYKQICAIAMEKVFMITPVWRAEPHNTIRHLNESRQMDIEAAFADDFVVMELLEKSIKHIIKNVIANCEQDLEVLNLKLKIPKAIYLSYKETLKLLDKNKLKIKDGEDLTPEAEKRLCELHPDTIIFVHSWPLKLKPFYIMPASLKDNEEASKGFDALYGGIEISSGGQRIHIPELLVKRLKAKGLNPGNFKFYVDSFSYGSPYHAGWSIGLERFAMALLKLNNIREACLFPRDRDRLTP